jgi:hypothetical protein
MGWHELYVPTYNRSVTCVNHGDFIVDGNRVTIYRQPGSGKLYVSQYLEDGQQTLPNQFPWKPGEFCEGVQEGKIERVSPVRGPP